MIKAGDILLVDTLTPLGLAIKAVLSTDKRKCHHSHDAVVFEEAGRLMVYNARIPLSKNYDLYNYLGHLSQRGKRWCIVRPQLLADFDARDPHMSKLFRENLSHDCQLMEGNAYSFGDLIVIFKRRYGIHWFFPWLKKNKKAQFYCTEAVKRLFADNLAWSWEPSELGCEFPAPIHVEYMCENGTVKLVEESNPGYFGELCGKETPKK